MKIIEIKALANGGHRNQNSNYTFIPEGWAMIPDDMETPNFPFGAVEVEEIEGVMTVTRWEAGILPIIPPTEKEPTTAELLNIILGVD